MATVPVHHDTFDLDLWTERLSPEARNRRVSWIDEPLDLARAEWVRREVAAAHDLGPAIPADVFVWSLQHRSWTRPAPLTQFGGIPWRDAEKPWPRGTDGCPLDFIGQISFVDSRDIVEELPGDVLLLFSRYSHPNIYCHDEVVLEWSSLSDAADWRSRTRPPGCLLPFCLRGVIHRTHQFPEADEMIEKAGLEWSYDISELQATCISRRASIPQGWPFEDDSDGRLLCMWSHLQPGRDWPFVNLESGPSADVFDIGFADAGCFYDY